jgi:hypothetical protein
MTSLEDKNAKAVAPAPSSGHDGAPSQLGVLLFETVVAAAESGQLVAAEEGADVAAALWRCRWRPSRGGSGQRGRVILMRIADAGRRRRAPQRSPPSPSSASHSWPRPPTSTSRWKTATREHRDERFRDSLAAVIVVLVRLLFDEHDAVPSVDAATRNRPYLHHLANSSTSTRASSSRY